MSALPPQNGLSTAVEACLLWGHLRPSAPQQSLTYSISSDDGTALAGIGFDLLLGIARLG
jgi:hypothetical protein